MQSCIILTAAVPAAVNLHIFLINDQSVFFSVTRIRPEIFEFDTDTSVFKSKSTYVPESPSKKCEAPTNGITDFRRSQEPRIYNPS